MPEAVITLENVGKTFDPGLFKKKVTAVRELSLEIRQGEVFGLIGPNGAGKSTTIRLILGLGRPTAGTIRFRGQPLEEARIQEQIGYLPENPYLYDHLTLRELLAFGGVVAGMEAAETARRRDLLLERLDLAGAAGRPLRTYSKGMLQRAGFCFALLHDPEVVILDEPMSGLDPVGRRMVFDLVQEMRGEGKTIFFCSHILSDVERLCDRIGLLIGGRLRRVFDKAEFAADPDRPVHLRVEALDPEQADRLQGLGVEVSVEDGQTLLSLGNVQLAEVSDLLGRWGREVLATRSERFSLERLFLEEMKGARQ